MSGTMAVFVLGDNTKMHGGSEHIALSERRILFRWPGSSELESWDGGEPLQKCNAMVSLVRSDGKRQRTGAVPVMRFGHWPALMGSDMSASWAHRTSLHRQIPMHYLYRYSMQQTKAPPRM